MATLTTLIARHPILRTLSSFLSTLDLFYLALTNRTHHSYILASRATFDALRRDCLCDGGGLAQRQNFAGLYSLKYRSYVWGKGRKIWQDEPIEVRLYATKCDEAGALPCQKCGINICEECRYYPREPPEGRYPVRRPHLNSSWQNENVMCFCAECDAKVESEEVKGRFLNELCDCDVYTRWICPKCVVEERQFTQDQYRNCTAREGEDGYWDGRGKTKVMGDHQHGRMFFCSCGASVPQEARPRCTWCKRRHLPESEWGREYNEVGSKMPMFDNDPCYPLYRGDIYGRCCDPCYAPLPYKGPIWEVPES